MKPEVKQAEEYLGLLRYIIYSMDIPPHNLDEAWSAGQVIVVNALRLYKPALGVPVEAWMAVEIRQALLNWQRSEYRQNAVYIEETTPALGYGSTEALALLLSVEQAMSDLLDAQERFVLKAVMFGLRPAEISAAIRVNGKQMAALLRSARSKIAGELFG